MKYFLSISFVIFFLFCSYAQISNREIRLVANNYLLSFNRDLSIDKYIKPLTKDDTVIAYVVELNPKGFMVFTANKSLYPLLAYSFDSDFIFEESPYNTLLNMIRDDMSHQLLLIKATNNKKLLKLYEVNRTKWKNSTLSTRSFDKLYGPLLPDIWGQVNCKDEDSTYINVTNFYTPNHYAGGCVALSLSQILHYYRWPLHGQGSHTNNDNSGASQGSYFADFGKTYYDWSNMLNEYMYKQSDTIERQAVGRLVYQVGTALDMDYEFDGSTSNINKTPGVLNDYFRSSGHYHTKSWSSFWDRFDKNIEHGHPLQLDIGGAGSIGHAPVCDGYGVLDNDPDINNRYYHLNMNWWGASNAWYRLRGTFNAGGYTSLDAAVFDILPDPEFEAMEVQNSNIYTLQWNIADNLVCDSFQLQKYIGGTWTTILKTTKQYYTDTASQCGNYQYRVRAKVDSAWYANSYSESITVFVEGDITSLEFDGNDSYFVNENNNLLDVNGSDWTIEAWIYPTTVPSSGSFPAIISRKYSFELYFRRTSGNLGVGFLAFDGFGAGFDIEGSFNSGSNTLSLDEWHHVAVSHNGNTTKMYFDGQEVGSSTDIDFDLDASIAAINFGARYDGSYVRYINDCRMDEIRYSKAAKYTSNFNPHHYDDIAADSDDILLMHLDEGQGYDIIDASGNFQNIELRKSPNSPNWECDANYKAYFVDATNGNDANPGTEASPWQTINKINNAVFEPGDHIKFKKGEVWSEFLYFDQSKNGTSKAPITLESYGTGTKPKIAHIDQGAIFTGSSNIVMKDFSITSDIGIMIKDDSGNNPSEGINIVENSINDTNNNGTKAVGIYLSDGANNCHIDNNEIQNHQVGIWGGIDNNNYQLGCNNVFSKNDIHDNVQNGIAFDKSDCSIGEETIIADNSVYNNGYHGIELSARYYIIENNIFYNNGVDGIGGASGIHAYSRASDEPMSEDRGGDHNIIRYNTINGTKDDTGTRTDGNGIQMDMWCDSNLIYNNVIYNNDGAGIILYGASGNEVYNNTMYGNGQDLGVRYGQYEMTIIAAQLAGSNGNGWLHSENNIVKNNIAMAVGSETTRFGVSICDTSILDNNIFSNNDWYNNYGVRHTGIVDLINHITNTKTISEWNAYSWASDEFAADPLFIDASNNDFSLDHTSPAIDKGIDLNTKGITDDFDKKNRPLLGGYDAGAYEHGIYWIGKYSSSWANGKNWSNSIVPDVSSCITILLPYTYKPIVYKNHNVHKIFINANSKLTIMQGNTLKVFE